MNKNVIIRRTTEGYDRAASSYAVLRPNVKKNERVARKFRFAKVAVDNAASFSKRQAGVVLKNLKKADKRRYESTYALVEV